MIKQSIEKYIEKHSTPETNLLNRLYRETHLKTIYPRMLSGPLLGQFLRMISLMIKPDKILEIGTFTGYSTICLAAGLNKNGRLHTIEAEPNMQEIFIQYFKDAKIEDHVEVHIGKAENIIPVIDEKFDLIFIDADKENYLKYYKMVFPKLNSRGFLLADNVLWSGKVLEDNPDKETRGIIEFNEFVREDKRVEIIMIPLRDGISLIRKK